MSSQCATPLFLSNKTIGRCTWALPCGPVPSSSSNSSTVGPRQPQMTNPYSQQRGVELVRNPTPITFSDYPPNICHSETYPSADTAPSKPENLTRINPPLRTKYSPSPTSSSLPRTPSTTATSTTTPSSKSDVPSQGLPGRSSPVRETRGAPKPKRQQVRFLQRSPQPRM